ncbi:MAG: bifunctional DNA primase/polymerase [Candidatus Bathyarchaeia archaeon]
MSTLNDLKAAARRWSELGLKIVPVKLSLDEKGNKRLRPLWKWQSEDYPGFERLDWSRANGYAVILGRTDNGWLSYVDVDADAPVKEDPFTVLVRAFPELENTYIEKTPHGFHFFIYINKPAEAGNINLKDKFGLEFHVNGLVIMAPTNYEGGAYSIYNNAEIVSIAEFYERFRAKFKPSKVKTEGKKRVKRVRGVRPCLKKALETCSNLPHLMRLAIAAEYKRAGLEDEDVARLFEGQEDYDFQKSLYQVRTADPDKAASCQTIRDMGFCLGFECPSAPKDANELLTEEEKQRACELLKQDLISLAVKYGRKRLIGEDHVLICNFVAICSGQTKYPFSLILTGFSGSGKNESLRAIKCLIPPEWLFEFTTATPEAVKYIPEEFRGTLLIYEATGVQSKTGTLGLRAIGEGEPIETIYPIRDELTGRMMMGRAKTNAKNFITTESDVEIFSDLYRRTFRLSMNDDSRLTKRVLAKKIRDAMLPESLKQLLGLTETFDEETFRNALRLNEWQHEVIAFPPPYLMKLVDLALTREQQVALRTHIEKIISFAKVVALIRQADRPKIHVEDKTYVVAVPDDFEFTLKVLGCIIQETVSRLEKRQQQVLQLFENGEMLDKHKVAEKTGFSTLTAYRILKALAKNGYLKEIQTTKPYSYELLREKPNYHFNLENARENCLFWLESLTKLVNSIISTFQLRGIQVSFEGISDWMERVRSKLSENTSSRHSCKGEMVPFQPDLTFFSEKEAKQHFKR